MHGYEHAHGHADHAHSHGHRELSKRALLLTLALTGIYFVAELIGGFWTNSLALLADAGHMFTDIAALVLSLAAMWFASRPPTPRRSFGYYRLEILAALINGASLIVISGVIFLEAVKRMGAPPEVNSLPMLGIAAGGLAVNLIGAWILHGSAEDNLNVQGALAHVIGDALGSVGAIAASLLMWRFEWYLADPLISVLVGILILRSAWRLVTQSVDVLLQATPAHIDPAEVVHAIEEMPCVLSIHDLHIWTVTSGMVSLSCHVVVQDPSECIGVLEALKVRLRDRFAIEHATIQVELPDAHVCRELHW